MRRIAAGFLMVTIVTTDSEVKAADCQSWDEVDVLGERLLRLDSKFGYRRPHVDIAEANYAPSAQQHLLSLPLVAAGMFQLDLMELRPFTNWSTLFQK
jgi:hypothetical protein